MVRVLVADDDPAVRGALDRALRLEGYDVTLTSDGQEALEAVWAAAPDAVVLDLLMPGVNGFETIQRLRAEQPAVAIVAHPGVAGSFVRDEMDRLDVPLVLKSGRVDVLADVVRAEVRRRRKE